MVGTLNWKAFSGWKIRLNAAYRCLQKKHYVLVCWDKCEDGDVDFKISHKGIELTEVLHRLKVDTVEILQDICDQNSALDEVAGIINKK